ncbi:anion exchange transporter [Rana temporaria]|uniref:anion exchange transporter n=1 Tax=Rana temporaria TaxID=8407 RepID=UPI001AAC78F9|nr:anion exchange transporter [Rana temporaria]
MECRKSYFSMLFKQISSIGCSEIKAWCLGRIPILEWAPKYNLRKNLIPDCISGTMLTVHQVAHGLAFAVMSSVHPMFGLYGSVFPPLIYAIFGMGRHVSTGTFAITSLISASAVERLVPWNNGTATNGSLGDMAISDFEMQRIGVAAAVTFLGGVIQMSMSLLQLGCATFLLSEPVVSAMTTGAATHVVTSQVKFLLGMKMPYISGPLGMFYIYMYVFKNVNMIQVSALLLSLLSLTVLILTKELNEKYKKQIKFVIPIDLILMSVTSLACYFANMEEDYSIEVIGFIPKGIPLPRAPTMDVLHQVVVEAFSIALVGYTVSIYLAYNSARRFKYSVSENQELFAHGLSNIIPSFVFCIPNAGAPARTFLLYNNGSQTQVACLVSCFLVLLVICFLVPLLYWLPMCVLASVIIVGLKGMLRQFQDLKKYWNVDKFDWVIWICTYVVTICFAANIGLLFGVVFNIAVGVFRLTKARTLQLVHLNEDFSSTSEDDHGDYKVVSIGSPLLFLTAKKFCSDIQKVNQKPRTARESNQHNGDILLIPVSNESCGGMSPDGGSRKTLILNCKGISFFDFTGVSSLSQICSDLKKQGTDVMFLGCCESLRKSLHYCNCGADEQIFFNSLKSALHVIKKDHGPNSEGLELPVI